MNHHPTVARITERPGTTQYYAAGCPESKKQRMQRNFERNIYASLDLQVASPPNNKEEDNRINLRSKQWTSMGR